MDSRSTRANDKVASSVVMAIGKPMGSCVGESSVGAPEKTSTESQWSKQISGIQAGRLPRLNTSGVVAVRVRGTEGSELWDRGS